jgi:tetratricopeptide (TPR) repeat protein
MPIAISLVFSIKSLCAFQAASAPTIDEAQKDMFAARYDQAAELYSKILNHDPADPEARYGLVRSLLRAHRTKEAYLAADKGLREAPKTAQAQTASGMVAYRRGDLAKAEEYFRAALNVSPQYPGALQGMASIYGALSKFKTARDLLLAAYRQSPDDPELILAYANTLKGEDHIAALERALAILDAASERAPELRVHIAADRVLGDRKLRQLISPYRSSEIKLFKILDGPTRFRGFGIRVQLNQRESVRLLLDTGASGVSVSPKAAGKAGLQKIGDAGSTAKGIGDEKAQVSYEYLASELRAGDVIFKDYPVAVFRSAQSPDFDGLIGANVFRRFIVGIDFPGLELTLEPRQDGEVSASDEPEDAKRPAPGFYRLLRFGDHLAMPTFINEAKEARLFLVDSGASTNLIDTATARETTGVYKDPSTIMRGVQGKVSQTSRANRVSLAFAGLRQENPDLIAIDLEKLSDSVGAAFGGIIGTPILGQLRLTIDYREGTARIEYKK